MSELLKILCQYALKGREEYFFAFLRSQSRAVLSLDPVKAHLPSGVTATVTIPAICPERTRGLLLYFQDPRAVL